MIRVLFFVLVVFLGVAYTWTDALRQKVELTVSEYFGANAVYQKLKTDQHMDSRFFENFFRVTKDTQLGGYIYVSQAPSMKNVFDYMIVFSPSFEILAAKVLIYREQHGRQIGTKRWLQQFQGLQPHHRPTLGKDVDGISGATISCKSMTDAVRATLKEVENYLTKTESK